MLYAFIKKNGNVLRVAAECSVPEEMQKEFMPFSQDGFEAADAGEWDQQLFSGAKAGMIKDASLPTSMTFDEYQKKQQEEAQKNTEEQSQEAGSSSEQAALINTKVRT